MAREGEDHSIHLISKGLCPFGTPMGRKMSGEISFLVVGAFDGYPLRHDKVVPAPPEGEPRLASPTGGGVIA